MRAVSSRPAPGAWAGYALVAGAATSWGAQSVVAKLLLGTGLSPAGLVSARTATAALLVALALAVADPRRLRVPPALLARLAVLGVVGMALSQFGYYLALVRIPVATALLVVYTAPLLVLGASAALDRRWPRARELAAAGTALAGAALVVRIHDPAALRPDAPGLAAAGLSAAGFAFYSLWAQRAVGGVAPWTTVTYSLASAALAWVPLAPPWRVLRGLGDAAVWAGFGVVVLFGTLVPFALYLAGLRRLSAAHASLTSTLEPVVAALTAYLVLGERLAPIQLVGGALVLGGIALLQAP